MRPYKYIEDEPKKIEIRANCSLDGDWMYEIQFDSGDAPEDVTRIGYNDPRDLTLPIWKRRHAEVYEQEGHNQEREAQHQKDLETANDQEGQ